MDHGRRRERACPKPWPAAPHPSAPHRSGMDSTPRVAETARSTSERVIGGTVTTDSESLSGLVALVSGATRSAGRDIAVELGAAGAAV